MSSYGDLTEGEQAHWNEYTNLRQISDWPGFDDAQDDRRAYARAWLQDRRAQLWHDLNDEPIDEEANAANKRAQRYDFLKDENLNTGAPKHEVRLPCSGLATDTEKVYIEEREVYLAFGSTTDAQKARKQANVDWLVERRKSLWHLMEDEPEGNEANDRENRYDNLCIATHHGEAYEDWAATHNKWGEPEGGSSGTGRQAAMDHLDRRVGYTESPPDSNQDNRSDGIKTSQVHCGDGATYLIGQPWCGCWCYYAAESGEVKGINPNLASVAYIEDAAKQGLACFRGWTTDRSKVQRGDFAVISGYGVHVETVRGFDGSTTLTYGGNTSSGSSGSQSNGGGAYERARSSGEVRGYALVDYPG
jgi:hypothetical protein